MITIYVHIIYIFVLNTYLPGQCSLAFCFCFHFSANSFGGVNQVMVLKLLKNTLKIIDRIMDWLANLIIFVVFCCGSSQLLISGFHLQLLVFTFICQVYTIQNNYSCYNPGAFQNIYFDILSYTGSCIVPWCRVWPCIVKCKQVSLG